MVDLSVLFQADLHRLARYLVDHPYFTMRRSPDGRDCFVWDQKMIRDIQGTSHRRAFQYWLMLISHRFSQDGYGGFDMLTLKAFGKALEIGPKVFCPSVELCDSLEQLDINVPLADFRLPFPTCFVEYPRPWADQLASALLKEGHPQAGRVPWFSMVAQTDPDRYISSISFRDSRPGEYNGIVVTNRGEDLFQEMFVNCIDRGRRLTADEPTPTESVIHQVNFNLGFLGHSFGTTNLGWLTPHLHRRHKRIKGQEGKILRMTDPERVEIDPRHREFFPAVRHRFDGEPGDGYRRSPSGHYIRGHYWSCPVGPRSEGRREYRPRRGCWRGRRVEGQDPGPTMFKQAS